MYFNELIHLQNIINKNYDLVKILESPEGQLVQNLSYSLGNMSAFLLQKNKRREKKDTKINVNQYIKKAMKPKNTFFSLDKKEGPIDNSKFLNIISEKIEDMPLYLNSSSFIERTAAEWRLNIRR